MGLLSDLIEAAQGIPGSVGDLVDSAFGQSASPKPVKPKRPMTGGYHDLGGSEYRDTDGNGLLNVLQREVKAKPMGSVRAKRAKNYRFSRDNPLGAGTMRRGLGELGGSPAGVDAQDIAKQLMQAAMQGGAGMMGGLPMPPGMAWSPPGVQPTGITAPYQGLGGGMPPGMGPAPLPPGDPRHMWPGMGPDEARFGQQYGVRQNFA